MKQFAIAVCLLAAPVPAVAAPAQPLNVLVLYADDWRHDTLSCAGNPVVKTPTLDQLAKEGVRFRHACVTTSICGVSRANLFTGQWMSRHGNPAFQAFKTPWAETYPGLLRANGYWVGHVGKWHNGPFPAENFDFGRSYAGKHYLKQPDGTQIHVTQKNENDALEFLRTRPQDRPFCLTLAFFATHAEDGNPKQYLCQPASEELYKDAVIPVPKTAGDEFFHKLPPFIGNEKNEGRVRWHWRFDTPEKYQEYMKAYYRLASEVDTTCGRVLAELKQQGVLDQTLVIFTTDNGYFHAEHGLADKWYPHEESIRVPLVVRWPKLIAKPVVVPQMVLSVDLAPSILDICGAKPLENVHGLSWKRLLTGERARWRTSFHYQYNYEKEFPYTPNVRGVRTDEWKYIHYPHGDGKPDRHKAELYHLKDDPLETKNLIDDPKHAAKVKELQAELRRLQVETQGLPDRMPLDEGIKNILPKF
jgi:arylsulfatase A-like enzyme